MSLVRKVSVLGNLTTIAITHGHGDHFFGLKTILGAFPNARAVTAAAVVPAAHGQLSEGLMQFWTAILPGQIPEWGGADDDPDPSSNPKGPQP